MTSGYERPTEPPKGVMYCLRWADGRLRHFHPSQLAVRFCTGPQDVYTILQVKIVPDDQGEFWCWHDWRDNRYCMVFHDLLLLKVCFPYGLDSAEKACHGVRVRARVEIVDENPPPETRS